MLFHVHARALNYFTKISSSPMFCWKPPGRAVSVQPQAAKYAKNMSEIEIPVLLGVGSPYFIYRLVRTYVHIYPNTKSGFPIILIMQESLNQPETKL